MSSPLTMAFEECGTWIINHSTCHLGNRTTPARQEVTLSVIYDVSLEIFVDFYVISLLCIVGIFGNILSVIVLHRDKERREALFLLQGLAVADAGYLVVALMRYPLKYVVRDKENYDRLQPVVFPLLKTFQTVTIWMLVLVTVDRFTCVCRPLRSGHRSLFTGHGRRALVVGTFIAGALYNVPRFLDSCVMKWVDVCTSTVSTRMVYRPTFHNTLYFDIYLYAMYIYLLYVGPLAILAFMNIRLVRAIKRSRRFSRNHHVTGTTAANKSTIGSGAAGGSGDTCSDGNATFVLIVVVIVFIICETPELILKIVTLIERHFRYELLSHALLRFNAFSELLMVVNSSVNFFVYLFFGRRFRHILSDTLRLPFKLSSNGSTASTRETLPLQYHHNCIHAPPARTNRRHQML